MQHLEELEGQMLLRISYCAALPVSSCAAFREESRMKFANATKLDRKSGDSVVERPAVPALGVAKFTRINPKVEFGFNPILDDSRSRAQIPSTCRRWRRVDVLKPARDPVRKLFSR
jgi:hypothetical protein